MTPRQWLIIVLLAAAIVAGAGHFTRTLLFPYFRRPDPTADQPIPVYVRPSVRELNEAMALLEKGEKEEARTKLIDLLRRYPGRRAADEAHDLLGGLNIERFLSKRASPRHQDYVVRSGDALGSIARRLDSTTRIIMKWNGLDSTLIHPGDRLIVPRLDFRFAADLPKKRLIVSDEGGFFAQFPIVESSIPKGRSKIKTKVASKMFWKYGKRLPASETDTEDAAAWINLRRAGYVIYGVGAKNESVDEAEHPAWGIALREEDMDQLQALVRPGAAVTIIR